MEELNNNKFDELKNLVESEFKKIGAIYCPALKTKVIFNSDGFYHLRYDNNRSERSKREQYNKLRYFNNAVDVINISTTAQEYRQDICTIGKPDRAGLRKTKVIEWFGFCAITNFEKKIRIKVIVRKIGTDGMHHFWSVMPFWKFKNNMRVVGEKSMEHI